MGSGRFYHPSEGRGVASGTSLSVATPQVCVKTSGKDKTLQSGVHCPAGCSPTEQSDLSTYLQTWRRLEAVSNSISYPASWESAHPGQNSVREAWRREWRSHRSSKAWLDHVPLRKVLSPSRCTKATSGLSRT